MIGKLIGFVIVIFLCSFVFGTVIMIAKELIARKRAARAVDKQNNDGEEDENRTDL